MMYHGIAYGILPSRQIPGAIFWSFTPPDSLPIQGKTHTFTAARVAAEKAIRKWLAENAKHPERPLQLAAS